MSKILIIGDLHLRYSLPYESCISDRRRSEWEKIKEKIIESAKECDAIIQLGDFFNQRHNHSSTNKEAVDFLSSFGDKEVHIISGNHSRYGTSTALDFLKNIKPNWHIYTEPQLIKIAGTEAFVIPFTTPQLLGVQTKEEGVNKLMEMLPKDAKALVFAHHGVTGSKLHGVVADFFNEIVLPKEEMEKHFWHGFYGHYHGKQMLFPSTYICGNVFSNEVGDHSKSVWTYESNGTIDVVVNEIPLPVRPIHKVEWCDDAETKFAGIPDNAIVKCYVTTRGVDISTVKKALERFDAAIVIEQYPSDRQKIHFENDILDLSVETMIKNYSIAKKINYTDLIEGFEIIKK